MLHYLADAASNKTSSVDGKKILPFGYCKRKRATIMQGINCHRPQTVSKALTELKKAGAITQHRKKHLSAMYFVDLKWLVANAFTAEQKASFKSGVTENESPDDFMQLSFGFGVDDPDMDGGL